MPKKIISKKSAPKKSGQRSRNTKSLSRDEIVEVLEVEIVSGVLAPGERIDERVLSARFNVSRMPVRDAIGRLASLGLIDVRPRSGSYVSVMETSELIQLFEFMGNLESLCARYAASRMSSEERATLMSLALACEDANDGPPDVYVKANSEFHNLIYTGAKNKHLESTARQMRQRIGSYRNFAFSLPGRLKASSQEHIALAKAIGDGDAALAQKLMEHHTDIKQEDFVPLVSGIEDRRRKQKRASGAEL
jgi:DNA-binding GntR family transcriptional regulator